MSKTFPRHFVKEEIQMTKKHMKRRMMSPIIRKMQIEITDHKYHTHIHLLTYRTVCTHHATKTIKLRHCKVRREVVELQELSYTGTDTLVNSLALSGKVKYKHSQRLSCISAPRVMSKECPQQVSH